MLNVQICRREREAVHLGTLRTRVCIQALVPLHSSPHVLSCMIEQSSACNTFCHYWRSLHAPTMQCTRNDYGSKRQGGEWYAKNQRESRELAKCSSRPLVLSGGLKWECGNETPTNTSRKSRATPGSESQTSCLSCDECSTQWRLVHVNEPS